MFSHETPVRAAAAGVLTSAHVTPPSVEIIALLFPTATHMVVVGHEIAFIAGAAMGTASAAKLAPPSVERSISAPFDGVDPTATQFCAELHVIPVRCPPSGEGVTVGAGGAG